MIIKCYLLIIITFLCTRLSSIELSKAALKSALTLKFVDVLCRILDQKVLESPQVVILPRPYVNPNKDKYKKKRPNTRPYQGTSESESEEDESP